MDSIQYIWECKELNLRAMKPQCLNLLTRPTSEDAIRTAALEAKNNKSLYIDGEEHIAFTVPRPCMKCHQRKKLMRKISNDKKRNNVTISKHSIQKCNKKEQ